MNSGQVLEFDACNLLFFHASMQSCSHAFFLSLVLGLVTYSVLRATHFYPVQIPQKKKEQLIT